MNAGHFDNGNQAAKGRGRPKGSPNKQTAEIKDMIKGALDALGGQAYLMECANDPRSRSAFLGLVGKVLPMTIAGDSNNPLATEIVIKVVDASHG